MSVPVGNTGNFRSRPELVFTNSWRAKMPRKKKIQTSVTDIFWDLIERHPELALEIAFSLGALAGKVIPKSGPSRHTLAKRTKNIQHQIVAAMPRSLPGSVLKYLPGAVPKLQPRQKPIKKRRARASRQVGAAS
jgi:hypothetical protein